MLKYYKLPSIKGEGWAHITINTETGFFATVSDWGNYSFIWTSPGGEFRAFLTQLQPDYLYGKLMMGRPDNKEFDEEETKKGVIKALDEYNASYKQSHKGKEWPGYKHELSVAKSISGEAGFKDWQDDTKLEEPWDYGCTRPCHDCMGFCLKVFPRFVELLKKELEAEKVVPITKVGDKVAVFGTRGENKSVDAPGATVLTLPMTEEDKAGLPPKMTGPDCNG